MLNLFDLKNKLGKRKLVIFVLVSIFLFVFSVSAKSVNAKTIDIGLINDYIHIPGRIGLGVTNPSYSLTLGGAGVGLQGTSTNILSLFTNSLERLTINANGNVGIGTTNPQFPLDVVGYIRSSQGYKFSGSTNGQFTISAGNTYFDYEGGFNFRSLPSYGSSLYLTNSGHVGIGITNPAARLTVNGNTVLGGATQITPLGGAGNAIVMADNTGNLYSTSTAAILSGQLWSGTKNGNIWNGDTGTGNVGIGKTNPAQKLDVTGVISASTGFRVNNSAGAAGTYLRSNGSNLVLSTIQASDVPTLNQNTTGSAYYLNSRDTRTVNDIPSDYGPVIKFDFKQNAVSGLSDGGSFTGVMTWRKYGNLSDFSGGPAIQLAYSDNGNLWTRLSSGSSAWGTWVRILNADSGVMLQTATPGTAQTGHMNISGTALFGGNVGIGTTNPSARLNVSGNTLLGGATQITALGGSGNAIVMTDNTGNLYATSTSAIIPEAMPVGTSGQTIRHDGSAWVANSNIFNNGTNVGVGKTNPAQKLDVSGSIQSTGDFISSASSVYLKSNSGTNTVFRGVRANTAWSDSVNAQWFQVGASSDNIAFTALSGTSAARMAFITNAFHVVTSAGSAAPVGLFDISNGSTKLFNVLNNGNVGIGITNPSARLNVSGNTLLGGATQITALGGSGNAIVMTDNTGNLYATSTSAIIPEAMPVGTSGQTIRHDGSAWVANSNIFNNGTNVGLGTATPGARLEIVDSKTHVSGSLAGTDSILRIFNSWQSDTVGKGAAITFEDNYYFSGSPVRTTRAGIKGGTELAGNNAEGFLAFYTDSSGANSLTERMRINSAGNVGIGITNPSARLNVSGSTILAGATQITPLAGAGNAVVMTDNTGTLYANAGMSYNRTAVSNVAYTAQASDYIIAYTYLSANRVLTLPATLCTAGKAFVITNETDSAYSVVVTPDSGRLISGQASISLPAFNSIPVYCNGTNWFIY